MEIKLIAMDLDGTALQKDHCSFSPRLNAALEAAFRRGVHIAPVTGRQYQLLPPALKVHPVWENLAVLCNGGQIRNLKSGEVLYRRDIGEKALWALLALAESYELPIEFSVDGTLYLTKHDYQRQFGRPELAFHRDTILAENGVVLDSLEPLCTAQIEKVNLLCIDADVREAVAEALQNIEVSAVWASSSSMEITHPEATKAQGLKQLCKMLDLPMENVMAMGDSGNDESMLRQAGFSVAMGNAPDHVKAWAEAVTESNDRDGAAMAIEKYVLCN